MGTGRARDGVKMATTRVTMKQCLVGKVGARRVARNSTSVGRTNVMNNVSGRRVALPRDMRVRGYPAYQEEPEQAPKRWPDEDFVEEVMEKFPDAGVADIEEGRVRQKTQQQPTIHTP